MTECRAKSFTATWSNWDISWPWTRWGSSTIRLPVKFRLELEEGSSKADCMVGQMKRGRSEIAGNAGNDVWNDFVPDGEPGAWHWWDGEKLSPVGFGEWDRAGRVATFEDKPGFYKVAAGQSLYMGAARGRTGYFDFKTFIQDRTTLKIIQEINWSMRIDVPTPGTGGNFWWSFSDQK